MNFTIRELGPIDKARLELGDLTVLIGPPNVGKSYTLKALYSYLLMLDPAARNYLLRQVLFDVLERDRLISDREIFRILLNLIVLYKNYPDEVGIFIKRISEMPEIDDISVIAENGYISATIRRYDSISLKRFKILVKDRINTLWDIVPTTDKTQVIINELPPFQLLSILLEVLKEPFAIEWDDYDRRLKLSLNYHTISNPREEEIVFEKTMTVSVDKSSPLITRSQDKSMDEIIYRLKEARSTDEILHIFKKFFIIRFLPIIKFGIASDERIVEYFIENVEKMLENAYRDILGASSISYIPFGRSPLVCQLEYISREPVFRQELLESYKFDIPLYSYISRLSSGRAKLSEGNYSSETLRLFEPVLQGNLEFDKRLKELRYKRWGFEELSQMQKNEGVPMKWASALAGEVAGILLPILAASYNTYIIIEEPESQLHYSAQVLMALTLIGLSSVFDHKIAFSTHSDVLTLTLAYIQEFKPDENKVLELIKNLLEMQNIFTDESNLKPLAKAVSEAKNIDVRFYYYEPISSGVKVYEKKSLEIMKDVPGITDVVNILATWAMGICR